MTRRRSFLAYAALLVGVIAFASSFARPTSGQPGAFQASAEGRYRLSLSPIGNADHVYVIDSATGHTWSYVRGRDWFDMGSPASPK